MEWLPIMQLPQSQDKGHNAGPCGTQVGPYEPTKDQSPSPQSQGIYRVKLGCPATGGGDEIKEQSEEISLKWMLKVMLAVKPTLTKEQGRNGKTLTVRREANRKEEEKMKQKGSGCMEVTKRFPKKSQETTKRRKGFFPG